MNQLNGTIPPGICSLTSLISLCVRIMHKPAGVAEALGLAIHARSSLSNNQLSGSIPTDIGSLTALTFLCACLLLTSCAPS